jgi:hypothetical protein
MPSSLLQKILLTVVAQKILLTIAQTSCPQLHWILSRERERERERENQSVENSSKQQ